MRVPLRRGDGRGRDSGARLGECVILLDGDISSGGSRVNWTTTVDIDSVIEIKDMTSEQVEMARKSVERYGKWDIIEITEQVVKPLARDVGKKKTPKSHTKLVGNKCA